MKLSAWLTVLLFVCVTIACNSQSSKQQPPQSSKASNEKSTAKPNSNTGNILKLTKHRVLDREATGLVASTYLLPGDWKVNDRLYWEYNDATVPIRYSGTYQSPDGSLVIKNYADVRAVLSTGPGGTTGYAPPSDIIYGLKDLVKSEKKGINFRYTG
ncbi:MAG: hypothetical protein ABI415_02085, partial [Flavitalea sp.]